jgi:hypothetical protein
MSAFLETRVIVKVSFPRATFAKRLLARRRRFPLSTLFVSRTWKEERRFRSRTSLSVYP